VSPLEEVLLGLFMGIIGVGLPTIRMINVLEGKCANVFFISLLASVNMYAFTRFAIQDNYYWMVANALGAAIGVTVIAYRRKNRGVVNPK